MIRDEHIDAAVSQGILTADQAARLRALAATTVADSRSEPATDPDDEKFRLIGGFNDVFVTIGVGLLIAALFALAGSLGFNIGFAALGMISAWGLAEFFSRRMRLALPSIALALMFAGSAAFVSFSLGAAILRPGGSGSEISWGLTSLLLGLGAAIAAAVHERRFRVPIDWAIAAVGAMCVLSGALDLVAPDWTKANASLIAGVLGLAVFAAAVRIDASDPQRATRRADIAFWLHLIAAPMIVHAVIPLIANAPAEIGVAQALAILAVFALLGLVALVIDRRALLVSGLTYAGIAIAYLLSHSVGEGLQWSLTLLCLAAVVLGLSAGWRSLRRALVPLLPLGDLRRFIPSPI